MFANAYQSGCITVLYSCGSNPLALWDKQVKNGHIRRIVDGEVKSLVLEVAGTNVATTYITCPIKPRASLGIKLPFLVMIIKNMKKYFSFEVQVLDDKDMHRRFRVSNFQSTTKVRPFCTTMPIGLSDGWNQIQFNLADFTKRAYGSTYLETTRVQVHANVRIRRIYFSDMLYSEDEVPNEFKMFAKVKKPKAAQKEEKKEEIVPELEVPKPPSLHEAMPSPEMAVPSPIEEAPSPEPSPEVKEEEEKPVEEEMPAPVEEPVEEVKEEEPVVQEESPGEEETKVEVEAETEAEAPVEESTEPVGEETAQEAAPAAEAEPEPVTETVEATTTEVTEEVTTTEVPEVATTEEPTTTEVGETTEEPTTDGQE